MTALVPIARVATDACGDAVGLMIGPVDDRAAVALAHLDLSGRGLEIGPSYSPLVPKASGARIETVDHADHADLVHKYAEWGLEEDKLKLIEPVDYIWSGGHLRDAVPNPGSYDYIIAAHVIEHTTDLIDFLMDCADLLTEEGKLALVVPDKRSCFDALRPLTTVGDLVDAHLLPTKFHTPGTLLDHVAYACVLDGANSWWPGKEGELSTVHQNLDEGPAVIKRGADQQEYYDMHRWVFTPASFELLIDDLAELGYQPFRVLGSAPPRGFEFYVTLSKKSERTNTLSRLERLRQIETEAGGSGLTRNVEQLTADLAAAQAEVAALRASRSWRLTAPLRAAVTALARVTSSR